MKNNLITLLLLLAFFSGFSQTSKYEYQGRPNPSVKKEKLIEAQFITDISPELWRELRLTHNDRFELEQRRKIFYSPGYNINIQGIDYVSVEISVNTNGTDLTFESASDKLNIEQKNILNNADLGTDIHIKIKFRYKKQEYDNLGSDNKIVEGELAVTVVPETEAKYPGGFKQLTEYLIENVINKISGTNYSEKLQQAIVKFTINEEGQVVNTKLFRTSTDPTANKLLLDAINKMPKWKPAENAKGIKVKQEFSIPFGGGC